MPKGTVILLIVLSIATFLCSTASACTTCHSKNPKMVRIHRELGFKNCFQCHYPGSKKSSEELTIQMKTDERCTNCHAKETKKEENPSALTH